VFPVLVVAEGDTGTDAKIWTDDEALKIVAGPKPGQFLASAEPACRPGWHIVRLHNKEGVTRPIPLWVDDLRNLAEAEPNDHHEKAAMVLRAPGSVRIHGRLERNGDVDGFRVHVPKGATLMARVTANRVLASPMDATLQIADTKGFVLAHNDDARGTDPEIAWTAPEAVDVIVRLFAFPSDPNSTIGFAGGSAYIYALMIATGPTIDRAVPIASDAKPADVPVWGWNLPADTRAPFIVPEPDSDFALVGPEGAEPASLDRGRVRLKGDLKIVGHRPEPADLVDHRGDNLGIHHAGGAPAEEHAAQHPARGQGGAPAQFREIGAPPAVMVDRGGDMRVEIAIGALGGAERPVQVQAEASRLPVCGLSQATRPSASRRRRRDG